LIIVISNVQNIIFTRLSLKTSSPFICAIVNDHMDLNNSNHRIEHVMNTSNKFKALFMGLLIIAVTFSLMASNTNGIVFAQDSFQVKVTIFHLPKQTAVASTPVTLTGSNSVDAGNANINIPGIGSGNVVVNYKIDSYTSRQFFDISVSNLPGQSGASVGHVYSEDGDLLPAPIDIPGIGLGILTVN